MKEMKTFKKMKVNNDKNASNRMMLNELKKFVMANKKRMKNATNISSIKLNMTKIIRRFNEKFNGREISLIRMYAYEKKYKPLLERYAIVESVIMNGIFSLNGGFEKNNLKLS